MFLNTASRFLQMSRGSIKTKGFWSLSHATWGDNVQWNCPHSQELFSENGEIDCIRIRRVEILRECQELSTAIPAAGGS